MDYLQNRLPPIVEKIFGSDAGITYALFTDYETNEQSVRLQIESDRPVSELDALEDQLFAEIEKDDKLVECLEHVTISCV